MLRKYNTKRLADHINAEREYCAHRIIENRDVDESGRTYRAMMTARKKAFEDMAYILNIPDLLTPFDVKFLDGKMVDVPPPKEET